MNFIIGLEKFGLVRDVRHAKIAAWWDRAVEHHPQQQRKGMQVSRRSWNIFISGPDEAAAFGRR